MKKILIKDFNIVSFRYGSRLQNGPEWAYKIVYCAPNGKRVQLDHICFTKKAALAYIRETVKLAEALINERDAK